MEDKPKDLKVFSWTLWKHKLNTENLSGDVSIQVRAIDSKGNVQDGDIKKLFNLRGILNNSPPEILFKLDH